jgi:peptide/nickel transport system substrate-binding protein
MGLEWDANNEFRLRPDGQRLSWLLEYFPSETPKRPITELAVDYWRAVGLDVTYKEITGELTTQRYPGNLVQMGLWHGDQTTDILFPQNPSFMGVPLSLSWSRCWGPLWARWLLSDGAEGEEPPEEVMAQWERWQQMLVTIDEAEQVRLGKEILASQAENLWTFGTVGLAPHPVIAGNPLSNFPEQALHGWDVIWSNYLHPEQFYLKQA